MESKESLIYILNSYEARRDKAINMGVSKSSKHYLKYCELEIRIYTINNALNFIAQTEVGISTRGLEDLIGVLLKSMDTKKKFKLDEQGQIYYQRFEQALGALRIRDSYLSDKEYLKRLDAYIIEAITTHGLHIREIFCPIDNNNH